MKTAIVLVGVPGSGKSTYAKTLNLPHFSSDFIRLELFGSLRTHHRPEDNQIVFDLLHKKVFSHDGSLIYDATNTERKRRVLLYNELKEKGFRVELHMILEPLELALYQNRSRAYEKIVPEYVIKDMYKFMGAPRVGVDCDAYKIISQSKFLKEETDFNTFIRFAKTNGILKTVDKFISADYLPEFSKLKEGHETPYHLEDIWEHIDMCINNALDDQMLITSILHDLGKSLAKSGGHYKGHDMLSSMYAIRFFDEVKNIPSSIIPRDIIEIIMQHMLAHHGISQEGIKRNKLNQEILEAIEKFKEIDEKSRITDIKR